MNCIVGIILNIAFWSNYCQNGDQQDFRITPHIKYAYIYCLNPESKRQNNIKPLGFKISNFFSVFFKTP